MNLRLSYAASFSLVLALVTALFPLSPMTLRAEDEASIVPIQVLGGEKFTGWSGFETGAAGATLQAPGEAVFQPKTGSIGWHVVGFRAGHDGTQDWRGFYGLQFDVQVTEGRSCELVATISSPDASQRQEFLKASHATTTLSGGNAWQRVTLPWTIFDYSKDQSAFLEFIQELRLTATYSDGKPGKVELKNIRLVRSPVIAIDTPARGKSVKAGETAHYPVILSNCTDTPQTVNLAFARDGFEAMVARAEPAVFQIAPGAMVQCDVSVIVPKEGVPPGGHESQKLLALASGDGTTLASLELITACDVLRPSILHTPQGWAEVREKVKHYDWAKKAQDDYLQAADAWQPPEVSTAEQRANGPEKHIYVFLNKEFEQLPKAAIAWQLTGDKKYAEKAALFLRRLSDEKTGYPSTFAGTSMGSPQEGGNFQSVAIAYDAILDSGVLSEADKVAIEHTFRLFMETYETDLNVGNMGNWSVAASTASLFCALAVGDLAAANRYIYGPAGFTDFLSKGVMDDGWWWECSTSYNFWVASELTQAALACQPWGIDLLHHEFPASYSPYTIITPWALDPPYGMSFQKWGPSRRNTRSIKQLWDAVPAITDYRGVAFGMNDGHEEAVGGSRLELGYYAFRDPSYVPLIKRGDKRDLIYGVPELPEETSTPYLQSSYAENLGFALLRSQTEKREPREQIAAVFKIGTQGGYHGHFDRVSLNTIMRYGRSFWNPESIWWGYPNFMYKFYVQNSVAHNMVVVDQKQQEAVPSSQLLFHSGKMMQAVVQETNARWSDAPYGGMKYDSFASGGAVANLQALMKKNKQSFPLLTDRKEGDLGPFTDRVLQRRLGIVTDDYIVVADYLKGSQPHTFDNLFQMKGFTGIEGGGKTFLRHDAQFNPDPHNSAQFITNCDWYRTDAPAVGRFVLQFDGEGHNEPGILKIDIHGAWPKQQEVMLAQPPEPNGGQQWVNYEVTADGKSLAKGESGMWILGVADIDVPVQGAVQLTLQVNTDDEKKSTLFLANARLVDSFGKETPLDTVPVPENIRPSAPGQDYFGGPIAIAGVPCKTAIPAQPQAAKNPGILRISLAGKNAVRFKATLGSDYPVGDEGQRRKIFAIRSQGTEARFLTVLEPYEDKAMVKSVAATGPDTLRVELVDGRIQDLAIQNLTGSGKDISVKITETRNGKPTRSETTVNAP